MYKSMYGYIWAYSKREQVLALALTAVSFPFLYFSFDLPKTIVNRAIKDPTQSDGSGVPVPEEVVPVEIFGFDFTALLGIEMERLPYLFLLCGLFLALVCVNGVFKKLDTQVDGDGNLDIGKMLADYPEAVRGIVRELAGAGAEEGRAKIVAVDLQEMAPIDGVVQIQGTCSRTGRVPFLAVWHRRVDSRLWRR